MTNISDEPKQIRPFADILRDLGRGAVVDDAAIQLQALVTAVQTHGKKGSLTLKVEVAPMKGDLAAMFVAARVDMRPPSGEPVAAVFFADDDGNLVRDDPKQMKLPLRDASATVDRKTGEIHG